MHITAPSRLVSAVPTRNSYAAVHQALADIVNIVHFVREMTEVAPTGVFFGIPVVRELDLRFRIVLSAEEYEAVAAFLSIDAADLFQSELFAIEVQRSIEVHDPYHRVKVFHAECSDLFRALILTWTEAWGVGRLCGVACKPAVQRLGERIYL